MSRTPLDSILGSRGDPVACRVISDKISVHWFASPVQGSPCLCGATTKDADEDVAVSGEAARDPADQERELHRQEALALHARYLKGELTEAQYNRQLLDIGKEPDDLTREP